MCIRDSLGYEANCDKENCTADVEVNGKKFDFLSWNEQQKSEIKIDDPVTITIDESYTVTQMCIRDRPNRPPPLYYRPRS